MATFLIPLLTNATVTGPGPWVDVSHVAPGAEFLAFLAGGTTPTATVDIEVTLDEINIFMAAALTPNPTAKADYTAPIKYVRANITAITGGGNVTAQMAGNQ